MYSEANERHQQAWREKQELNRAPLQSGIQFHDFTDTPCGRALAQCEAALGRPLEQGEMSDFLLDNFMEIADSNEAHEIRDACLVYFGRVGNGKWKWSDGIVSAKPTDEPARLWEAFADAVTGRPVQPWE